MHLQIHNHKLVQINKPLGLSVEKYLSFQLPPLNSRAVLVSYGFYFFVRFSNPFYCRIIFVSDLSGLDTFLVEAVGQGYLPHFSLFKFL